MSKLSAIKVFFDSDAVIAGSASSQVASFILLQLAEIGLIQGITSHKAIDECRKNIQIKLPEALRSFEQIILNSLSIIENPPQQQIAEYNEMAHQKDVSILTAAIQIGAQFLVTFNTKDFYPDPEVGLRVIEPGDLLKKIRFKLSEITDE